LFYKVAKRRVIAFGLVLSLIFSQYLSVFAALSIKQINLDYLSQDITLICTGKTFKLVSLSAFEQTGELVFIEPPSNAPEGEHSYECPSLYALDKKADISFESAPNLARLIENNPSNIPQTANEQVSLAFLISPARAPPYSIHVS
jgi:hypothetical protein